jgi:hypothetical protein
MLTCRFIARPALPRAKLVFAPRRHFRAREFMPRRKKLRGQHASSSRAAIEAAQFAAAAN